MPYMELRSYKDPTAEISLEQRDLVMELVRDHLAQGQGIDGTFEFRFLKRTSELDWCEYEYILVIDMGYSEEREKRKSEIAAAIGRQLAIILHTQALAVRLRLQNAGFVPYKS